MVSLMNVGDVTLSMPVEVQEPDEQHPYQVWRGPVAWVAKDPATSVASQGDTPEEALENLLEALEGHRRAVEEGVDRTPSTPDVPWLE